MRPESRSPIDRHPAHPIRSRVRASVSLLTLLVATVQGITPDLDSLASSCLLDLLRMHAAPIGQPADNEEVDLGGPVLSDIPGLVRQVQKSAFRLIVTIAIAAHSDAPLDLTPHRTPPTPHRTPPRSGVPLLDLLCHLTC